MGSIADVTLHIDESLPLDRLNALEEELRRLDGISDVSNEGHKPHLLIVRYDPSRMESGAILGHVKAQGLHGELVGL